MRFLFVFVSLCFIFKTEIKASCLDSRIKSVDSFNKSKIKKALLNGSKLAAPNITVNKNEICENEVLELNTPYVEGAQYFWSGPSSFTSEEQNPQIGIVDEENSGEYQLYIKVGDYISETAKVNIIAHYSPKAIFTATGRNTCKSDQYFLIEYPSIKYAKVTWDFGEGVKSVTDIDPLNKKLIYATSGKKIIKLIVENDSGCSSVYTIEQDVKLGPEQPTIQINKSNFCLNDIIELSTPQKPNINYNWKGPDGFTANSSSVSIPITSINKAGKYELYLSSGGCSSDIASVIVPEIDQTPIANFITTPNFNIKFSIPASIQFSNTSQYATQYQWDVGDGKFSNEINPFHIYSTEGTYKITLNAYSENGCFNSIIKGDLAVLKNGYAFSPNAFSPNGDGVNDEFVVNLTNLLSYNIQIVNRLGSIVFRSDNILNSWNGKYNNKDLPTGVYYYIINARNIDKQEIKLNGSVTLIR